MKSKLLLCLTSIALMLAGCSSTPSYTQEDTGSLTIGGILEVNNTNNDLILSDNKDILSSDGLYYTSWVIGDAKPYENSDGETIDLYDAQLYLLLEEFVNEDKALTNLDSWIGQAKTTYDILSEEEVTYNGQTYTLFTYKCTHEDNPYDHGVSAFGIHGNSAVCIELTCTEDFDEDLEAILTEFLGNCTYYSET